METEVADPGQHGVEGGLVSQGTGKPGLARGEPGKGQAAKPRGSTVVDVAVHEYFIGLDCHAPPFHMLTVHPGAT